MGIHFVLQSARDFLRVHLPIQDVSRRLHPDDVHLDAAVDWLLRSIDAAGGRASSKAYRIGHGWMPPYRETTGYIIPTLLDVADRRQRPELRPVADRMGEWLAEVQSPEGGFVEQDLQQAPNPIVFNTGMILHGFNALILRRDRKDLIPNARRAGEFLVSCMDKDGCFDRNHLHQGIVHAFNVRAAWALLTLGRIVGEERFEKAALANADWTLRQQNEKGFFLNNAFRPLGNANTHGLAYVLQGLLEIHGITGDEKYAAAVRRAADRVVSLYGSKRRLVAELGPNWEFLSEHICVTGYAQLAIVLLKLHSLQAEPRYLYAALIFLYDVCATQNVTARGRPHFGGIKGSMPIYGRYAPLQYPNWATKFFVDALLAKAEALNGNADRVPVQLSAG